VTTIGLESQSAEELNSLVARVVQQWRIPGLAVAVCKEGRIVTACGGLAVTSDPTPMSDETRFQTGCVTQMLLSLAAHRLASRGDLDIQLPVSRYLPELMRNRPEILTWHLMSHCSGYRGIGAEDRRSRDATYSWSDLVSFLRSTPQVFDPGSTFNYHMADHVILGEIIRRQTGVAPLVWIRHSLLEASQSTICSHTYDAVDAEDHEWDADSKKFLPREPTLVASLWAPSISGLSMSILDMAAVLTLIDNGCQETTQHLKRQVVRIPLAPLRMYEYSAKRVLVSYGLGCGAYSDGTFGISGSTAGQCCGIYFHPERRIGLAIAINGPARFLRERVVARIFGSDRGTDAMDQLVRRQRPLFDAAELEGEYIGGIRGQEVQVSRQGARFEMAVDTEWLGRNKTEFELGADGAMLTKKEPGFLRGVFFRDHLRGAVCLMLGMRAYKRAEGYAGSG
jgi:CubicO group peptidase (beta-lactamase class C family)